MTGLEHTLVAVGSMAIASFVSFRIGKNVGLYEGFSDGSVQAVQAMIYSLEKTYGMEFKANIIIDKEEDYED